MMSSIMPRLFRSRNASAVPIRHTASMSCRTPILSPSTNTRLWTRPPSCTASSATQRRHRRIASISASCTDAPAASAPPRVLPTPRNTPHATLAEPCTVPALAPAGLGMRDPSVAQASVNRYSSCSVSAM